MLEFFNEVSGLLTILGIFLVGGLFFVSLKAFLQEWRNDYDEYKKNHCKEAGVTKENTYHIRNWLEKQDIHQAYMKKISEDSVRAVQDMNGVLSRLSNILESIEKKLDKWESR
jgi:5-bromo-4-chloroindolyl phosphate hydrolysis protein